MLDNVSKKTALFFINFYKAHISPYKGFRCAYAFRYNTDSCSDAIKRIIEDDGLIRGWSKIIERFRLCSIAYESTQENDNTDTEDKEKKKKRNEACDDDTYSKLCVKTCNVAQCAGCFSPFVGQVKNK